MTAANNEAPEGSAGGVPQEDDPFAYLYRPQDGESAPERAPGVPRTSYARPMEVGRAQYGQHPPQYQQPYRPQGPGPGAEHAGQVPQQSRYAERSRPQPGEDAPRGRGKGAVIGVVAVIAAIAIGSGIALSGNDGSPGKSVAGGSTKAAGTGTSHPGSPSAGSASPPASPSAPAASATVTANGTTLGDAATMTLAGGTAAANSVTGAKAAGGSYVGGLSNPGASVTWSVHVNDQATYQVWVRFNNTGADASAVVAVDGTPTFTPIRLKNYTQGLPASQAWYNSWVNANMAPGDHRISLTCAPGSQCGVLVDQLAVTGSGQKIPGW